MDSEKIDNLKSLGYKTIEVDSVETYNLRKHPFVYGHEIVISQDSLEILKNFRKNNQEIINRTKPFIYGNEYLSSYEISRMEREMVNICNRLIELMEIELNISQR